MAKALKIIVLVVVISMLALFIAVKLLINEDQIKQQLQELVRQQTNGSLSINGPLSLAIIPRLSLSLGQLSYQLDTETTPLGQIQELRLGVGLWPLLSGRIEVDEIGLAGLKLQLRRDQQSVGNWEQVQKVEPVTPAPQQQSPSAATGSTEPATEAEAFSLSIAKLSITDAVINFEDQLTGASYKLENFSMGGSNVNLEGDAFPLAMSFSLALSDPALQTTVQLSSQASLNPEQQRYRFEQLEMTASALGEMTRKEKLLANISTTADLDLEKEQATFSNLKLNLEDIELNGNLTASRWSEQANIVASIAIGTFNPGKLLPRLGIELPATSNPDSLGALSLSTDISYTGNQASMDNVDIMLDKSHIQGNLALLDIEKQKIKAAFAIDQINLDDYLPPEASPTPAANPQPALPVGSKRAPAEETILPVETLAKLNYDARLTIGILQASGLALTEVKIKSTANKGLLSLNNFYGKLYGGEINAAGRIDSRPSPLKISFQQSLENVKIKPLAQALSDIDTVSGLANFNSKLETSGNTLESWKRGLNGPVNFNMTQLQIDNINLEHMTCQAIALTNAKSMPEPDVNRTDIESVNGQMQFKNGVLQVQSIKGDMKTLNLKANGNINLLTERLDLQLGLRIAGDQVNKESACRANSSYRDIYWPIRCKGLLATEAAKLCKLDEDELAKISTGVARDKLSEKAKDKVGDALNKFFKKNKDN